jgi:putative transposase
MMDEYLRHSCHKVYCIKYHFMFCVKYRKDIFLEDKYLFALKRIFEEIALRYFLKFETLGIDEDHVHMLLEAAPKYSPSQLVQMIKSISAKQLFKMFPEIKDELWGGEFWSDGGYIGTVGEGVNADIIRKYIKKQGRNPNQLKLSEF